MRACVLNGDDGGRGVMWLFPSCIISMFLCPPIIAAAHIPVSACPGRYHS